MSISPGMERTNPANTLRGIHAPVQMLESIARQEEAGRREAKEKIMVVQKCIAEKMLRFIQETEPELVREFEKERNG